MEVETIRVECSEYEEEWGITVEVTCCPIDAKTRRCVHEAGSCYYFLWSKDGWCRCNCRLHDVSLREEIG